MAKITRKNMKIFGSTAGFHQIGVFGSLAAAAPAWSTDPDTIQSLSNYLDGLYQAVVGNNSAALQDTNAIYYLYAYQLAYLFQTGVPEWNTSTVYYIGSVVNNGTNTLYVSLTDNNTGNALSSASNWQVLGSNFTTKTANYTAALADQYVRGNTTGGAFTVTLPAVATSKGMNLRVKNVGTIAAGFNLTIAGNAAELIDDANTQVLAPLQTMTLFCNGTNWDIF